MGYPGYTQEVRSEPAGMFGKTKAQLELQLARDVKVKKNSFSKNVSSKKGKLRKCKLTAQWNLGPSDQGLGKDQGVQWFSSVSFALRPPTSLSLEAALL